MKKQGIIIDITNNFLVFWPSHCSQIRVFPSTILSQSIFPMKTAFIKIDKDITSQKRLKRGLTKDMTDLL